MKVVAFVIVFLLSTASSQLFQANESDSGPPERILYPIGDVRNCAYNRLSGLTDDTPARVLETLPGLGFDNLRNFDMDRVHTLNYSTCKMTSDGKYILPDGYFIIPQHGTDIKLFSQLFANWYDYFSLTSSSINAGGSLIGYKLFSIGGTHSEENRRVKIQQVQQNSVTTRAQLRRVVYTVKLGSSVPLHPEFRKQVYEIAANLASKQDNLAHYCSELLVRDFGTHYLTSIDVGGVFAKNDYVSRIYAGLSEVTEKNLTSTASFGFPGLNIFNGTFNIELQHSSTNIERSNEMYRQNLAATDLMTVGGPPLTEETTIDDWQNGIIDNLAIIDRSGDPISFAISPGNFPEIEGAMLRNITRIVQETTERYFKNNNIRGCVDVTNENFNFQANNPGSCQNGSNSSSSYLDRAFGGIFQNCTSRGREPLCRDLNQLNPLTGGYSCPNGYQAVLLNRGTYSVVRQYSRTEEECSFIFFCDDVIRYFTEGTYAQYGTYWCAAVGEPQESRAYLFGGYFSTMTNNPFTATPSCPLYYQPQRFGRDASLCTSSDYELGTSQSVKFGGFFSCLVGNPLATGPNTDTNSSTWTRTCPMGYTQHLVTIENDCEINVCLEMGSYGKERLLLPKLPPYREPQFNPNGSEPIAILGSLSTILIKNTQGEWITYNITDPIATELLTAASTRDLSSSSLSIATSTSSSQTQSSSTPTGIAITALVFGIVAIVAITILIFVIVYKARKWEE